MITKRKCIDLLSNSLNTFFKKMYRDQFGEFVCGYWCLKDYIQMNFLTNNPGHSSWGDILNTKLDQSIFTFINTGKRKEVYITRPEHTLIMYNVQKTLPQTFSYDTVSTTQKFCPRDFIWMVTTQGFHLQILMLRVMHTLYTLTITWPGSERVNGYLYDSNRNLTCQYSCSL